MLVATLARKPLKRTVTDNVLKYGVGGLAIDACRIIGAQGSGTWGSSNATVSENRMFHNSPAIREFRTEPHPNGRWPANLILVHSEDCRRLGVKCVKGNRTDGRPEGDGGRGDKTNWRFRPTDATRRGYSDEDGMESVEEWECPVSCPIVEMDRQSGDVESGASRFFKQLKK